MPLRNSLPTTPAAAPPVQCVLVDPTGYALRPLGCGNDHTAAPAGSGSGSGSAADDNRTVIGGPPRPVRLPA